MSFIAVIDRPKSIATWCRSCVSLAGTAAQIQFSLSPSSLAIQAVNASRTTHAEVLFETTFFRELSMEGDASPESRTFVVSSKHLIMLFKNLEPNGLNYICLRVESSASTPVLRQYKLNVEMLSKKLVLKKYQISFQPASGDASTNLERYNEILDTTHHHQFVLQTTVMKSFFDMVPISTEDFGIDVKLNKINFTAYTKQVMKDRDYLKQPMSIMISMATDELPETTLGDVDVSLNFRLKDFRNFITLISNLKSDNSGDVETIEPESTFDAAFREPASPILFQHIRPNFAVRFLQITVDDGASTTESFVLNIPKLHKQPTAPAPDKAPAADFDLAPDSKRRRFTRNSSSNSLNLDEEETDYTNSEDENVTVLGPTQNVDRPKSLFD